MEKYYLNAKYWSKTNYIPPKIKRSIKSWNNKYKVVFVTKLHSYDMPSIHFAISYLNQNKGKICISRDKVDDKIIIYDVNKDEY